VSSYGKYVTGLLKDMGFSVHMADPSKLPVIYKSTKKDDRGDSYKLARALHLGKLSEVYLPSAEIDDLRSMGRYRKSIGEGITMLKNAYMQSSTGMAYPYRQQTYSDIEV